MRASRIRIALAAWTLLPHAHVMAQHMNVGIALGVGTTFTDPGGGTTNGFAAYTRVTPNPTRTLSLAGDLWFVSIPHSQIVTGPCLAGSSCRGGNAALHVVPGLVARQGYEKVTLLYRFGPLASWFPQGPAGTSVVAAGLQVGLSLLTTRQQGGLLLSVDYQRLFRGGAPQWFVPLTLGWQF